MKNVKIIDSGGDKKYFTIIPNYVLNHASHFDREVYIQMKRIAGETGFIWTSQTTLAENCGFSIKRLKQSLKYLITNNWIEKVGTKNVISSGGKQKVNEYKIIDIWDINTTFFNTKNQLKTDTIIVEEGKSHNEIPLSEGPLLRYGPMHEGPLLRYGPMHEGPLLRYYKEEPALNIKEEPLKKEEPYKQPSVAVINQLMDIFYKINPSLNFGNITQRKAILWSLSKWGLEETKRMYEYSVSIQGQPFSPVVASPLDFKNKIAKIKIFHQKNNISNLITI